MSFQTKMLVVLTSAALATGCGDQATTPTGAPSSAVGVAASRGKLGDMGATASWNELATSLADRRAVDQSRLYAYLSLAQFRAGELAINERGERRAFPRFRHSDRDRLDASAAIGGASAVVLKAFFPNDAAEIDAALAAQVAAGAGRKGDEFAESVSLGMAVGDAAMVYAAGDRVGLADPGTPPIGPGYWQWNGGPIIRANYRARPFFLASDDEFRSPPPPEFGSPAYLAALAEVREISDTRTPEQLASAIYWNLQQSGRRNAPFNNKAVALIRAYHVPDARAARIMFLMNGAMFDALVGCFDAKYAYWFIRPPQADPLITLPIGLPPHPSYPSAHSCVSGSMSGVLRAFFPSAARELDAMSQDASLSRLYAGIHYRFDMEAGLALGRKVAAKALAAELSEVAPMR